jgi:fructose-bisphosphate aldolase class II
MIVTTADLYKSAYGKYSVGAYNVNNLEQILGMFRGCIDSQTPFIIQLSEISMPKTLFKPLPGRAAIAALKVAVAGRRVQSIRRREMDSQLMRVPWALRRSILPDFAAVERADQCPCFNRSKEPAGQMRIRLDPSDVVRIRPRWKTPLYR